MEALTCREILAATKGILLSGDIDASVTNISTDSRRIKGGELYIPIVGERFDGHDYIGSSLSSGAAAALTHKDIETVEHKTVIKVEDTLKALRELATYYRNKFKIPFVGITGSVGKTSTKDMVAGVVAQSFNVLKTEGNFNNEIGLPLTVFNLVAGHEAAVIEMGMSGFGEISRLTSIVQPDIAIITNIGVAHIEKLGSRQNILKAKMEILEGLGKNGLVVLNGDDKLLYGLKGLLKQRTVFFGTEDGMDYQAYDIKNAGEEGSWFEITVNNKDYSIHVPVPGIHNVYNALAAIATGIELGIPMGSIIKGIAEFVPGKMRMNIISNQKLKIINDVYNASPQSMEAAITVLKDISKSKRTVAVLGDMLEMGEWAEEAHRDIGKFAVSSGIDYIITIGQNAAYIAEGALNAGASEERTIKFSSNDEAAEYLKGFVKQDDVILVKGSRGMKLEQIVDCLSSIDI